jgi:photosystem II stability/assembly factor-like uncharacterized protein
MLARLVAGLGLVAGAQWSILDNNFDTIILAVAFSDTQNGIVPYDDNGSGPGVKVSSDGGKTWSHGTPTKYSSLLMDAAFAKKNAVIGGTFDTQFSTDGGKTFSVTSGDKLVGQNCETISGLQDDQFFGITGNDILGGNGVAASTDGGKTVKFFNISIAKTLTRYGAFPSRTTWYISAGQWPQSHRPDVKQITSRLHLHTDKKGRRSLKLKRASDIPRNDPGWMGEIYKTTDGGKTWQIQFHTEQFYFNGIDCSDETHCCAVGESDSGSGAGARILCTMDGKNWNQTYFGVGAENSLLGIRAVHGSSGEWWAGGGLLPSQFNITGTFPHSTDGGNSWTMETLKKVYITDLSIVDAAHGWGTSIEEDQQSGLVILE